MLDLHRVKIVLSSMGIKHSQLKMILISKTVNSVITQSYNTQ